MMDVAAAASVSREEQIAHLTQLSDFVVTEIGELQDRRAAFDEQLNDLNGKIALKHREARNLAAVLGVPLPVTVPPPPTRSGPRRLGASRTSERLDVTSLGVAQRGQRGAVTDALLTLLGLHPGARLGALVNAMAEAGFYADTARAWAAVPNILRTMQRDGYVSRDAQKGYHPTDRRRALPDHALDAAVLGEIPAHAWSSLSAAVLAIIDACENGASARVISLTLVKVGFYPTVECANARVPWAITKLRRRGVVRFDALAKRYYRATPGG